MIKPIVVLAATGNVGGKISEILLKEGHKLKCFIGVRDAGPPCLIANSAKSYHLGVTNWSYV